MTETVTFFSGFQLSDLWFMAEAAGRTLLISILSISIGSALGCVFGWASHSAKWGLGVPLNAILDLFRSVPLIIQLILFYNFFPMIGLDFEPFTAGVIILSFYTSALVANVTIGGIEAVGLPMRRAARSLGMSYWQDLRYVVFPIGLRAVFPAWVGVALSVLKDSALVSALGYVELLKASQILMTRTPDPFIILAVAGAFYFALSYPISKFSQKFEEKWSS